MWKGPDQDPGGGPDTGPPPGPSQELSDLKDQFEQQQVLIAQLKEMIRKNEQSNVTQENVVEYMNTLSKRSGRAKKQKTADDDRNRKILDIPASQKINLLRQKVEENKAKFAERGKSQKGIEEMVTQIKAQLDDSQQLISQTPLNLSHQDIKVEYSENSSSHELYMILLTKEKRITDLITKVQKLENNVLDLQENVKEKDSVIDARTKAITLMTENLSRKGKSTLDALDETKEQMRKMQENFVALEAEMKARQLKLLEDLKLKNYEIAELQEINNNLQTQNKVLNEKFGTADSVDGNIDFINELKEKIRQLVEAQQKSTKLINQHETTIIQLNEQIKESKIADSNAENEEVAKLKKQLEDSNKNMIKVKALHKNKVKELTKQIEAFKKVSDVNAAIVKLEAENSRLNQKVAELEEEKGTLQLKLVETDSTKGSDSAERENELEEKIQDHLRNLEEKDKIISILEVEISRSKNEIDVLTEKLSSLSHLENAQVKSEMASIQFEEQMDSLENEKKQLMMDNENTIREKEELSETVEILKKEKQELATKLEHYIQENIELIDKLEKLSAEKVSSAESIEMVEALTQQEKLELEAYHKNLDLVAGNLKGSEENIPQNVDLNESVNELTEETSELLQKIELFTVERREVMEKMEQLRQENSTLNLKIKEIENNRDVLAETYEQLQSEKELLDSRLEAMEKENESVREELAKSGQQEHDQNSYLTEEIEVLKQKMEDELQRFTEEVNSYKTLIEEKRTEFDRLQSESGTKDDKINELNNCIVDLKRTLSDYENDNKNLQTKINQLEEQKVNLSQLIDRNQEELDTISNREWENRRLLESKDNEITKLMKERDNTESVIADLQKAIKEKDEKFSKISADLKEKYLTLQQQLEENSGNLRNITEPLEAKIGELTSKNKDQLEKMKKIAANLKKKTQAYQDLEAKLKETQDKHEVELKSLLQQLQDLESEVHMVRQAHDDKLEEVRVLEEKNVELQNIVIDLKTKADKAQEVNLEQELLLTRENLGSIESSLQAKIQELEMIIETQESELRKSRERVNKLEEGISFVEERRLSLERRANELGAELEEKSVTCEEISRSEDLLERRLAALTAHDEAIEKKLGEAIVENQDLSQHNKKLNEENDKLKKKFEQVVEKMKQMENQRSIVENLEAQNEHMKKHIHHLESELNACERTIEENKNDFDRVNADWQTQFDEILKERTELMIRCEKFEEELKEIAEKELIFNDELVDYKIKLEKSESEIKNYEEQIQKLSMTNAELEDSRRLIEEKDIQIENYHRQNEEQLHRLAAISEELENLKKTIDEKDVLIEDYQRQIQMLSVQNQEIENLKRIIQEKDVEIDDYQKQNSEKSSTLTSLENLKKTIDEKEVLIEDYRRQIQTLSLQNEEIDNLKRIIQEKNVEIANYQMQNSNKSSSFMSFFDSTPISQNSELVTKLQEEIAIANDHLNMSKVKIEELQKKIEDLEINKTNSLAPEAEVASAPMESIPTFVWSGQTNDPFDFIAERRASNQETLPQHVDNVHEELLSKLKTLEFMLYNAEKEKEEALLQCHQLSNEVTRLIYDRQPPPPTHLESQILSEVEIEDTPDTAKELQKIEFERTQPPLLSSFESGPVVEEVIQAKEAYLCYDEESGAQNNSQNIESQIISDADIVETPETRRELQQLEFEETKPPISSVERPVKEDPCSSKETYLCYTLGENDDGWGWGPEEGKLEEEHAQKIESAPLKQLDTLKEKIRVLEIERENHLEEIKQLQIKSGKLIKKLKELKQKNEELNQNRKKSESDLFNLDDTIQEELKLQIQQVEKKLKEITTELEKEKNEKSAILKRIDVLTAANERMVEMKEKQDIELLGWQQNYRDLSTKLERFEWGDDGFNSTAQPTKEKLTLEDNQSLEELHKKLQELNETIKDLTLDNEELQTLLEEQRNLRIAAEKSKTANTKTEAEYSEVVNQLQVSGEEKKQLQDQVNELIRKHTELLHKLEDVERQNGELIVLTATKDEIVNQLENQWRIIAEEKDTVERELQLKNSQIDQLENQWREEKDTFVKELQEKNSQMDKLSRDLTQEREIALNVDRQLQAREAEKDGLVDELTKEKEVLFKELQEKNSQIDSLKDSIDSQITSLKSELENETKSAQTLLEEKKILTETLSVKDAELVRLLATLEQMAQEWERRVDQRGDDVAESWKLHLETRETEFAQMEQLLRKEINELEEKTNALVNENNELRKNVDAEIRNEVDRVAALQQQINDRQQYINDLTRTLQEKQVEVEQLQQELKRRDEELDDTKKNWEVERAIVDAIFKTARENRGQNLDRSVDGIVGVFNEKEERIASLQKETEEIRVQMSQLQAAQSSLLDEKNRTIATLTTQLQEIQNLKDYESENAQNLQQNLFEYQQINATIAAQLQMKSTQIEERESELNNLQLLLEEKQRQHEYAVENLSREYRATINEQSQEIEALKRRLHESENHYEALLAGKDAGIEELKTQSEMIRNKEVEELSAVVNEKTEECKNLQKKIEEQSVLLDEENKQLTELRAIIEEQVLKIEELKNELYEKSNDYDSLVAEMDISGKEENSRTRVEDEDLTEPVSRAELDLALYMLHQRDVRCEELTVELTQLLEERDTLQLRLSNAIREKEDLGRKVVKEEDSLQARASVSIPQAEVMVEPTDPLTTKLTELKAVGYKKDKTILDEQEARRMQQFSIMQQHRDMASKLPPEAAARLVDASYTLSRDVQSPSKVLLNWLWGRSTPRVNNI